MQEDEELEQMWKQALMPEIDNTKPQTTTEEKVLTSPEFLASLRNKWGQRCFQTRDSLFKNVIWQSTSEILAQAMDKFSQQKEKPAEEMKIFTAIYLNEIWLSEFPPNKNVDEATTELVIDWIVDSKKSKAEILKLMKNGKIEDRETVLQQILNLKSALEFLFGHDMLAHTNEVLSISFIQGLHAIIGDSVIESAGQPRKIEVKPLNSNAAYCISSKIEKRLATLIAFYNEQEQAIIMPRDYFLLAALFMSEFLLIHPFVDGNGRTARLLTNYLLRKQTLVPFSIFYKSRAVYLDVLEKRSCSTTEFPSDLASYILAAAEKAASNWIYLLMD